MAELNPDRTTKVIKEKIHHKPHDNLPFTGWGNHISRNTLAQIFNELGYKSGAEVGVRWGDYSKILCDSIPGLKLFCIDPYIPYGGRHYTQEKMDIIYRHAQKLLAGYDVTFIKKTSVQAAMEIPDNSIDFVYIDGLHEFDYAMLDTIYWTPKVRPGGIVAGHDYVESYSCGVVNAIRAYTYAHAINEWFLTRVDPNEKEKNPSWFFVRREGQGIIRDNKNWY
jgi:hypothetical protein